MDSPAEVSDFSLRTFRPAGAGGPTIRFAAHHDGTDTELEAFWRDMQRIVAGARDVFGEFPSFEGNTYTFSADYLPWANGDGMEHRNSTILTSPSSIGRNRANLLDTVAHEFLHAWNVERIRPRSLEPFDFERANMSSELWFGEGFTSYYAPLVLRRAGLTTVAEFASDLGRAVNDVIVSPGRRVRSAAEMSQLAPFVDASSSIDRTSFDNTYISYYTWGSAIGLGLDLSLRDRTSGRVTLDHFMRTLWQTHGRPGGRVDGAVDRPYTMGDLRAALATVSGDGSFAADFFDRYIEGREVVDYERLLYNAGIVLRRLAPDQATAGALQLQGVARGVRVIDTVPLGSPAYEAGLARDDVIVLVAGAKLSSASDWSRAMGSRRPGDTVPVTFERRGSTVSAEMRLVQDPRVEAVPVENIGGTLSDAQRAFRAAWLEAK
jgi:predicted metalloprotease with PDZ domain